MGKYTKYRLYQKYETRGSQEAIPCYPNVFSIDGDGTMPLVIVEENSRDCGYTGETQPIYRWYTMPIDSYYYCDACQDAQYRWVNISPDDDWECVGTTKYLKQKKQVSVDGGSTWTDVSPAEYQRGAAFEYNSEDCGYRSRTTTGSPYCEQYDKYVDVYSQVSSDGGNTWQTTATTPTMVEHNSAYCGYIEPQYRTTSGSPYCSGYDKYVTVYYQVSYDGGSTWSTYSTTSVLIEAQSQDCGYVPVATRFKAYYNDGSTYSAACNYNTELTINDTQPSGYDYSKMIRAEIGDCITTIGRNALSSMPSLTSVTIASSVRTIGLSAFTQSSLRTVSMENGVTTINDDAFKSCYSLTSITIPNSVTSIGNRVFWNCSSLPVSNNIRYADTIAVSGLSRTSSSISLNYKTRFIGDNAFWGYSAITNVYLSNNIIHIGQSAFTNCYSLTSINIPSGVTSIGASAFNTCSGLTSVTFAENSQLQYIGANAFKSCRNLKSISDIPNSVITIGNSAFTYCNVLTSVTIGSGVTTIGNAAFYNCYKLTSIEIPNSVTTIGASAFTNCSGLTSVTIGSGVTAISGNAFYRCSGLTSVTVQAVTPPTMIRYSSVFDSTNNCPIYVPSQSVNAYKSADGWSSYSSRIQPIPT